MNKKLLLMLNPKAGQRRANHFLPDIIRLYNDKDYECVVYVTSKPGDAFDYIQNHFDGFERIVCVGGDGTLNETVAGMTALGVHCPIGYIPSGTTNDFAASIGLSPDIMQAAEDSIEGNPVYLDMGTFNGRYFNYTASCGAFAKASYSTPQVAKNTLGHLAYILEGIRDIPNIHPIHMTIESGDSRYEDDYIFCSVTNSLSVGGVLKLDPEMVLLNDGLFEVLLVKYPETPLDWTRTIAALSSCDIPNESIKFFSVPRLKIHTDEEVEWTLDGERGDTGTDFEAINLHRKMELVLPRNSAANPSLSGAMNNSEQKS